MGNWLFLEAADVWMFRDGRPFRAGEAHVGHAIFPPRPSTLQGALRSLILGHKNVNWQDFRDGKTALNKEIGTSTTMGDFSLNGPLIGKKCKSCQKIELWLPLPSDVYKIDKSDDWQTRAPKKVSVDYQWTDWGELSPLKPQHKEEPTKQRGWLVGEQINRYLAGKRFRIVTNESPHGFERRVGISIDYNLGHAKDQMLYQAEFIRPNEGVGMLARLGDGVALPQSNGCMSIGGEGRTAYYEQLPDAPIGSSGIEHKKWEFSHHNGRFKLILQTPAWFSNGWCPQEGWSTFFGGTVECVAVSLGKPISIGGWNLAKKWHKVMRQFVPAGSVYYFEAKETIQLPFGFTQTPESENSEVDTFAKKGFGTYFVAGWDWL